MADLTAGRAPSARSADPPWAARFWLDIDKVTVGAFTEVGGLGVTIETEDLVEGGENGFIRKLPKAMRWQNLVLKRGVTNSDALLSWLSEYSGPGLEAGGHRPERRTVTITVYRTVGKPAHIWRLEQAMPVRWSGPRLSSTSRELALEELEVSHCGLASVRV
ncbi:MAG TPA: phage tail protein [Kineosporiaceae bacterium]|nr:phage tail protein [Kineosporiaceae bacterium]